MDDMIYYWDEAGQLCYRYELEEYVLRFGDNYDSMTSEEFWNTFDNLEEY